MTLKICSSGSVTSVADAGVRQRARRPRSRDTPPPQNPTSSQVDPRSAGDRPAEMRGERGVAAQQPAAAVEHGDRIADRVEGLLPLRLPRAHEVVEPRVLHGDGDLPGDDRRAAARPPA